MGKINLDNYEAYFLDFTEGNLAEDDRRELAVFLNMHPELKAEMEEDLADATLIPEAASFDAKGSLKVTDESLPISKENIEDLMIAQIERQLSPEHESKVLRFIEANQLRRTLAAYQATILQSNAAELFRSKETIRAEVISVLIDEISSENIEEYMVGYHEGTLSDSERIALSQYIEQHALQNALRSFGLIKLEADQAEVFENRASLKKRAPIVIRLYARVVTAAAVGLVIFGLAYNFTGDSGLTEGSKSKGAFVSDDEGSAEQTGPEKPLGIHPSDHSSIAYEARDDNTTTENVAVITNEQFVEKEKEAEIGIPNKKDSLQPELVMPPDLIKENDDEVELYTVRTQAKLRQTQSLRHQPSLRK
jgi:hypothetical protein